MPMHRCECVVIYWHNLMRHQLWFLCRCRLEPGNLPFSLLNVDLKFRYTHNVVIANFASRLGKLDETRYCTTVVSA